MEKRHSHANLAQLALVTDGDHDARTDNPHATDIGNLGAGTLAELNTAISDANLYEPDSVHAVLVAQVFS